MFRKCCMCLQCVLVNNVHNVMHTYFFFKVLMCYVVPVTSKIWAHLVMHSACALVQAGMMISVYWKMLKKCN